MKVFAAAVCMFVASGIALAAKAETAADKTGPLQVGPLQIGPDCDGFVQTVQRFGGYDLTAPPAGTLDGWCVLDGATLHSKIAGWPNLSAERLRIFGDGAATPQHFAVDITGLRVLPVAVPVTGAGDIDDRVRALFRLQSAELRLDAFRNDAEDRLELRGLVLRLSGGTEVVVAADIRGAGLDPATLMAGSVTLLEVSWRNDGRLASPVMELAGESLAGTGGTAAVDAARAALATIVADLPDTALTEGSRAALKAMVADLPQGRGTLHLSVASESGIGAARIALAALSDPAFGPKALAALLQDARIDAAWKPGIAP